MILPINITLRQIMLNKQSYVLHNARFFIHKGVIMYQIRTFNSLCFSKKYVKTKKELNDHIKEVISATNKYRKGNPDEAKNRKWEKTVNKKDLEEGIEVLSIDNDLLPEFQSILGKYQGITDPYLP